MTVSARVLVIGDLFAPEMEPVRIAVDELARSQCDVRLQVPHLQSDWHPQLVIICQESSDQFTETDIHHFLCSYPLARFCCCFGAWCNSDGRTRDLWPAAVRIPVSLAAARIRRELAVIAGTLSPLPLTASREEIFAFDLESEAAKNNEPFAHGTRRH